MRKKAPFTCLLFFFITTIYSQVGIGTTDPQKELHVSGNSSTIRIDGLNSTNNTNNNGAKPVPVHINATGDLILPSLPTSSEILLNGENIITATNFGLETGPLGEYRELNAYSSPSFTLTQPAIISVQYSMSLNFNEYGSATEPVTDGKPRIAISWLHVGDGTTPDTTKKYGNTAQTYTNSSSTGHISTGFVFNSASDSVLLPAGTHSIHLYVAVSNYSGFSPTASDAYRVYIGAASGEYLKIIANY